MPKKILIVEDQLIVRKGLRMMLESSGAFDVVGEAENGFDAIAILETHQVDVVLLDIHMPVMNGVEATKLIKERWPKVKILILTTFADDEYAIQTLKDGANGYLLKTEEPEKLVTAIQSICSGGIVLNDNVAAKMIPKLLVDKKEVQEVNHSLTARELDIVKLVGEGLTNKEIAAQLFLSVGTVKNHLTNILHTLELRDRTQLAIYAIKNDFV